MGDRTFLRFTGLAVVLIGLGVGGARGDVTAGQFAPRVSIDIGGHAYGLAGGDFNGDGRRDLAVGNNSLARVTVLFGQPNGTLGGSTTISTSSIPLRFHAGDLNGDGRSEVMYNNFPFTVAYGQANNTFSPITDLAAGGFKFATADLNNDGRQDIALTSGSQLQVHFGIPGGFNSQLFPAGASGRGIAIADFNGDNRMDVVTTNEDVNRFITVMTALPAGGYSNINIPGGRSESILVADFNEDNRPDLAFAEFNQGAGIKYGQPGGGFSDTVFFPVTEAFDIAAGDFNDDGNLDLATVTVNFATVSLLLGDGAGSFVAGPPLMASAQGSAAIVAGDFDGNGMDDIAVASASGPNVDIFYQIPEPATATTVALLAGLCLLGRRSKNRARAISTT